ncbi:M13 family metallopeptidase [Rothia sp. P6271]|uniref:M13 family metallopeptidase n=1 Tax=unclassified Rothia (in: high G+C Gram-positive bacteria) TaxID=2689056 RepID=UPI003ACCA865
MSTKISGINTEYFDQSVAPSEDFFRHVNGRWIDNHVIPADRSKDGGMYTLRDRAEENVREIIEQTAQQEPESRIGILYQAFMDTETINKDGISPILSEIDPILLASTREELFDVNARASRVGVGSFIGWYTSIDVQNPERYVAYLMQSGLGLPDESYYREEKYEQIRRQYQEHIRQVFSLSALDERVGVEAEDIAERIMLLETKIASHHWDKVTLRDAHKRYNPYDASALEGEFPGFAFSRWFELLGSSAEQFGTVIVGQPSYLRKVAQLWQSVDLQSWKLYSLWKVLLARVSYLNDELVQAHFEFFGRTLSGTEELRPRWKRGVSAVESYLGEELGQKYVAQHFPPAHKEKMLVLVQNLIKAYHQSISELPWMTEQTRGRALEKLSQFVTKVGYPDSWRDYSSLELVPGQLCESIRRAYAFETQFHLDRIGQPVNKDEWLMTPQTVNAYYMPPANEIVFPAAILQAPYFDPEADDAANYGGIGAVIGHEIGHGFDDQGSKYDGTGALNNWWTDEDREEFGRRTQSLVDQYSQYTPRGLDAEQYRVNGELTLGENIGDLGGLSIALKAYRIALQEAGVNDISQAPVIDGFTALQRVFIAWGQGWRTKTRPQQAQMLLSTDPHSPDEFRVNGVVKNIDDFYDAFDVPEGSPMYLSAEDRVRIW